MPGLYKVTASALNLRAAPDRTAPRLATIPRDSMVSRFDDAALAPDWYKVSHNGREGYAASQYLTPVANGPAAPPAPSSDNEIPPAPAVAERDRDLSKLHPAVRGAVSQTVADLTAKGIPFRVFEAFRTPERQTWLFAQGRSRPGSKVTNAQAWQSMHQYGLAVDMVLFGPGGWSWDDSGEKRKWWTEMQAVAKKNGLAPLSFELPHVELAGSSWQALQRGEFPTGGDESWHENLAFAAERWRRAGRSPYSPPISPGDRPPLPPE